MSHISSKAQTTSAIQAPECNDMQTQIRPKQHAPENVSGSGGTDSSEGSCRENYSPNRLKREKAQIPAKLDSAQILFTQNGGGNGGQLERIQILNGSVARQADRKSSLADCDDDQMSCEEMKNQEEQDTRCQLKEKLIKNKQNLMEFNILPRQDCRKQSSPNFPGHYPEGETPHFSAQYENQYKSTYQEERLTKRHHQSQVMVLDKRYRSETPNKMSASDVIFRAHQKLQMRRKKSPSQILEKTMERQKKAEEVRSQIENTKKKWYEKIRKRQEIAKQKWKELLAQRKRALFDKLEQAEERRETEIELIREKAKQENVKIDETNYIVKMTMNNMKLDINNKMTETLERRNQILEENKRKHHDRHLKEEAAEKRRQELIREHENRISRQRQKREQAEQRRNLMLEQKKRAAQEYHKRIKVLQRKNDLDKMSDVMSFVNNSEFIWEFLGNENDWQEHYADQNEDLIFELMSKDQLEIKKMRLKRDADLLNKAIGIDEQGRIFARKEYLHLINKLNKRRRQNIGDSSSSGSSEDYESLPFDQYGMLAQQADDQSLKSPKVNTVTFKEKGPKRSLTSEIQGEESKIEAVNSLEQRDCSSDNSEDPDDSIAEESILRGRSEEKPHDVTGISNSTAILTDEAQKYMLYQLRMKMSMKRNILKKSLSEDLTWAEFLKNDEHLQAPPAGSYGFNNPAARSLYSTPERKPEIPCDKDDEEEEEEEDEEIIVKHKPGHHGKSKKNKYQQQQSQNKKGASQSSGKQPSTPHSFAGLQSIQTSLPQLLLNQSGSNLSDKNSRLSSVVYPSTKKKNPKNEKMLLSQTAVITQNEQSLLASSLILSGLASYKHKGSLGGGSNTSSTTSLLVHHQTNTLATETSHENKTGFGSSGFTMQGRRSFVLETDSGRKKQSNTARLGQDVASQNGIVPQNIFNTQLGNPNITTLMSGDQDDKAFFDTSQSLMNQLITNSKPIPSISKIIPKRLTANANKFLFPIQAQKLLLKRPGKDGLFGKFKITVKLEELTSIPSKQATHGTASLNQTQPLPSSIIQAINFAQVDINQQTSTAQKLTQANLDQSGVKIDELEQQMREFELPTDAASSENIPKSQVSTPKNLNARKESSETENSSNQQTTMFGDQTANTGSTPPTIPSKLLQVQQKFLEKLQSSQTGTNQLNTFEPGQNLMKKKNALAAAIAQDQGIENTPSPKKDYSQLKQPSKFQHEDIPTISESFAETSRSQTASSTPQNDQLYKEQIVRYLLVDNIQHLKLEESQKTIFLEGEDSNKLVDFLENNELQLRYCRLCEILIPDTQTVENHFMQKTHKKCREDLQIKDFEDFSLSLLTIHSSPGDIEKELQKEKEKALKRKVKRIKAQMIAQSVNHETAASCPGKDFLSTNKKRCQILCIELEKQVVPTIKDYDALESSLKEIIKILDMRKQADLHLMRKLKFIPILIEICKRISVCHKSEFKFIGRVLEYVIKVLTILCGLRENRNYMLQTNRLAALIELLNWCLNRPTQLFYGINFVPQLFHILTLHVKHRAPYECQQMKEFFIEYLISSQITMKIKTKFQIINGPLDLSEMMGQVPMFLLKSANFLESLTYLISMDAMTRPVYEKTEKIGDHVFFVIQNTELFGIVQMIATILLTRNQPFKPSQLTQNYNQKVLPQTIISLAITSIKIINNVFRMDYRFGQQILGDFETQEQLYHLFNYILHYAVETFDKQEDSKELLHETIMMIGYFCLNNEKNQALLCRGENTIIQRLCALPIAYFHDKKLKDILYPTLIQVSYKNERSLAIMDNEISIEMIVSFIQSNTKEELSRIIEEENDYQSISSLSGAAALERRSHRSPSISSTNSSQCSMQIDMINGNSPFVALVMRFPKKLWKDAIQFYQSVLY